ncbi:MAG: metallophosphoesterase family protein [Flammeovirgaceae bacterium]
MFQSQIPKTKPFDGRRWVIPDIHGCLDTFLSLLEKVKFSKEDYLFLLGDYIDRGKNSAGVLDKIIELQSSGFQIFAIRGNHEQMMLDEYHQALVNNDLGAFLDYSISNKTQSMLNSDNQLIEKYKQWMIDLPFFIELDVCYLVHGGFNFHINNPLEDFDSMLWIRRMTPNLEWLKGKFIVHGHTPTYISTIKESVNQRKTVINLDNGCVFKEEMDYEFGNLLCLNIDTFELFIQQNID